MAEKMNKQLQAAPLLPVPVEDNAVLFVSMWGLINAGAVAIAYILIVIYPNICNQLLPVELTDEEAAKPNAFVLRSLWFSVGQAAVGTLALLLSGHRRRALAYVVLAAAVAGHCMHAGAAVVYLNAGAGFFLAITIHAALYVYSMVDLDCFFDLMRSE